MAKKDRMRRRAERRRAARRAAPPPPPPATIVIDPMAHERSFLEEVQRHRNSRDDLDSANWSYRDCHGTVHIFRGQRRLTYAAQKGWHSAVTWLLEQGADVQGNCFTALHQAASQGLTAMCKLLLSHGASLDARADGDDPEARARRGGRTTTAAFLASVRAAGGWRAYCDAPFLDLRRELLAPGVVANSSVGLYQRVFVELPNDVFPRVLAFRPAF